MAVGSNQMQGVDMPFFSRVMPSVDTLIIYALAMVLQGLFLLVGAVQLEPFPRQDPPQFRQRPGRCTSDPQLRHRPGGLDSLRSQPVSVIHHAPDGSITAIAQ
jgi:hypothetical protein